MQEKEQLKHYVLFIYSFKSFSQKQKVKFIRELFGYKNIKKNKVYEHKGLLQKTFSAKLAQNVILVPIENSLMFTNFFNSNKIRAEVKEVWLKD